MPFVPDETHVLVPAGVEEIGERQVLAGEPLVVVVPFRRLVDRASPAGRDPRGDAFSLDVPASELFPAAQPRAEHGGTQVIDHLVSFPVRVKSSGEGDSRARRR